MGTPSHAWQMENTGMERTRAVDSELRQKRRASSITTREGFHLCTCGTVVVAAIPLSETVQRRETAATRRGEPENILIYLIYVLVIMLHPAEGRCKTPSSSFQLVALCFRERLRANMVLIWHHLSGALIAATRRAGT